MTNSGHWDLKESLIDGFREPQELAKNDLQCLNAVNLAQVLYKFNPGMIKRVLKLDPDHDLLQTGSSDSKQDAAIQLLGDMLKSEGSKPVEKVPDQKEPTQLTK